jgi:hypothetical protein
VRARMFIQPAAALIFLASAAASQTLIYRGDQLAHTKARIRAGDARLLPAYVALTEAARKALAAPLVAVTDKKTLLPPTNDKHDYFSLSPYWWPDSTKPNGLPYIRNDGVTNPESKRDLDQPRVATLGANVHTLALMYYFSGEERYAERAAGQIRRWFLDPATRMTPHLRFAQLVRGRMEERGSGIIDTRWFIEVVDAVGLLQGSRSWKAADERALREWFRQYLTWLRTTPNGKHEHDAINNHGSWFAAQTTAYALFVGDTAFARQTVDSVKLRIGSQITPEGRQPIELERTRSLHYAGFNIEALSRVAEMGRQLGIDLWGYESPQGGSLRRAIDHVAPYVAEPKKWPGPQIDDIELSLFILHLRRGRTAFGEPSRYADVLRALPLDAVLKDRSALLYPDPK